MVLELDPARFPFLSGLQQIGMSAIVDPTGTRVGLVPREHATAHMLEIARANSQVIIREITLLGQLTPQRDALQRDESADWTARIHNSRWFDPAHNIESAELTHARLFAYLNCLHAPLSAYWEGEPSARPTQRPYAYVDAVRIGRDYSYRIMLVDHDGTESIWGDCEMWEGFSDEAYRGRISEAG